MNAFITVVLVVVVVLIVLRSALFLWDYTLEQLFNAQTDKDKTEDTE